DRSMAQLNLDRTIVRAPVNGFVTNLTLDVGQYAAVGTKVMALIDSDSYRVTDYFEETKIPVVKRSGHVDIPGAHSYRRGPRGCAQLPAAPRKGDRALARLIHEGGGFGLADVA